MLPCVGFLSALSQTWCMRYLYYNFMKSLPANKLIGPDFLWTLILGLVFTLPKIFLFGSTAVGLPIQFMIMYSIGTVFWSLTTIFSFLVIGTPCAYLSHLANECSTSDNVEDEVPACVGSYKKYVSLSGKTLFISYSFLTLELVLLFYWLMVFVSCIIIDVSFTIIKL